MTSFIRPYGMPDFAGVQRADAKIAAILPPTPLLPLDIDGVRIWCKAESEQPVGAFKLRGAWHRLTDLSDEERARGVVAFSSGNHAQGVAWAAQRIGIAAVIVMPSDAPALKIEGTKRLGAEVVLYDRMSESREEIAARIGSERGAVVVPSFDDRWIVEGQGSCGLEASRQIAALGLGPPDLVVAPCGGGGLASGLALAIPDARIAIAEPQGWDDMKNSLATGEIVPVGPNPPPTACDALQTLRVSPLTFGILKRRDACAVSVSEDEIRAAMRLTHKALGLRLEAGGAVGLAALMAGKIEAGRVTLAVLSGGNIDPRLFETIIAD